MMKPVSLGEPADLAALEAFLASDQAPDGCMTLSELDGFLAGIAVGPELVMPSEWLPMVWRGDQPAFKDMEQANAILGTIMRRYNELLGQLGPMPPSYRPILLEAGEGKLDGSDWALGFVAAIALRQAAWEPLVADPEAAVLLTPIMLIASATRKANLPLEDDEIVAPPDWEEVREQPGELLSMCVTGIRLYFMETLSRAPCRRRAPARRKGAAGKRRRSH